MVVILAHICWINLYLNDICLESQSTRKMSHLLLDRTSFDLEMGLMFEGAKNCPRLFGAVVPCDFGPEGQHWPTSGKIMFLAVTCFISLLWKSGWPRSVRHSIG